MAVYLVRWLIAILGSVGGIFAYVAFDRKSRPLELTGLGMSAVVIVLAIYPYIL